MKIKQLTLHTNRLSEQKHFYQNILAFALQDESEHSFSVQVGWTRLEFRKSEEAHIYHYCFLIPSNKLQEALVWMESKVAILDNGITGKVMYFDTWNAHSFYFYDGAGNIAECIVRPDLQNTSNSPFSLTDLMCVNEIGLPTQDIAQTQEELHTAFGLNLWRGDLISFAASGSPEGLLLLPNYHIKETWFPTDIKTTCAPFTARIENEGNAYNFDYRDGKIFNIKAI